MGDKPWNENEGKYDTPSSAVPKAPKRRKRKGDAPPVATLLDSIDVAIGVAPAAKLPEVAGGHDVAEAPVDPARLKRAEPHEHALLRSFIERIENINDQIAVLQGDRRDLRAEAKSAGFTLDVLDLVIRRRKLEPAIRDNLDMLLELYEEALGMRAGSGTSLDVARDERLAAGGPAPALRKKPTAKDLAMAEAIGWAATRH